MTWHNLHVYLSLLRRARAAIVAGTFGEFQREFSAHYTENTESDENV
jgi:tRNA-guanine family transglycosylase